jgi:hypothetical protein
MDVLSSQTQNLLRTRDFLLPRLLSGRTEETSGKWKNLHSGMADPV